MVNLQKKQKFLSEKEETHGVGQGKCAKPLGQLRSPGKTLSNREQFEYHFLEVHGSCTVEAWLGEF